jgi:cellulose synthase/poly-beta-1,6-N-acetylglucosamine synthase-like glycosyltransferase
VTTLLVVLLIALTLPGSLELLVLTLAGLLPARKPGPARVEDLDMVVVVPAHDEEDGIGACVRSLIASDPEVPVVVVADNCTDHTRQRAAEAGARVLVRTDDLLRGKGHALDHAFGILLDEGTEALVVVDADTEVAQDFLTVMRDWLASGSDAVQCRYGVLNTEDSLRTRLMKVALLAFNVLRPRGRARLGASAGICGNGFAVTAETVRAVPYDAHSVVEDLEYHLRLVRAGRRVDFADGTDVRAVMPTGGQGSKTQRSRWEGGRLRMLRERAPSLAEEVIRGRLCLLEPLLDLLLLPLATHVLLLVVLAGLPSSTGRILALSGLVIVALHVGCALKVGSAGLRDVRALLSAPFYIAWKIGRMPAILFASRGEAAWVRTKREVGSGGR